MKCSSAVPEVEVIASTRRRWSEAEKRAILDEAAQRIRTVSEVARLHGLTPALLFRWRRELKKSEKKGPPEPAFVPLALPAPPSLSTKPADALSRVGADRIEIVLDGGRRIIVGEDVDTTALRRIIDVLDRRAVGRSPQGEG